MKHTNVLGLLGLGLMLTTANSADARHRCHYHPPFDQGYGCYFAAPYVGTGRYCAGFGGLPYGYSYGPGYTGPATYMGSPIPTTSSVAPTNVPYGTMTPTPAAPVAPAAVVTPTTPVPPNTPMPAPALAPAPNPAPAAPN